MFYRLLGDAVVVLHAAFVLFVLSGGLIALRWRKVAWLHVPCVLWGLLVEFAGWICPLTPLENCLREMGGQAAYPGDFVGRYLLPVLYPERLTRGIQIGLGLAALALNAAVYLVMVVRRVKRTGTRRSIVEDREGRMYTAGKQGGKHEQ